MANNITFISLIIFMFGQVQCNPEKITYLLSSYEITNFTDVIPRRISSLVGDEKSLQVKAFGKVFVMDLTIYFPREDFGVHFISKLINTSNTFLGDGSEHQLYYGYVRGIKNSYAIGFLSDDKYFKGYIFTDEVYCIEPYEDKGSLIVYRFKDVIVPGCSKMSDDQRLDCTETKYFEPWNANEPPKFRFSNYTLLLYDKYFEMPYHYQSFKTAKDRIRKRENEGETVQKENDREFHHEENTSNGELQKHLHDINVTIEQSSSIEDYDYESYPSPSTLNEEEHRSKDYNKYQFYTTDFGEYSDTATFKKDPKHVTPESYPSLSILDEKEHRSIEDLIIYSLIREASKENISELQCDVEVVVGPSLIERFGGSNDNMLKDIYTQFTLLDMILRKVTYSKGDKSFHLSLNVKNLVVYGDEVYSPFTPDGDLEYFSKVHQPTGKVCLSIGLVNRYLRSGQLFDGYIPEGGGGACAKSGNTILVSYGNERAPVPMGLNLASLIRAVTRALGANDRDSECQVGSYPNPMMLLQDYLLNESITIPKKFSIFTECNVREIVNAVVTMKGCFSNTQDPLCGNGIVDEGEECDCGPAYRCNAIDHCCNPPVRNAMKSQNEKGCTLIEGAKCGLWQECCSNCDIQKKTNILCYSGNDVCDIAVCDGKSADCPSGVESSDGMVCSEYNQTAFEPTLCKDFKCDTPLCTGNGLQPCTCARGTAKDCSYCCIKDGKCKTAGSELQLMKGRDFFLPNGVECTGGTCLDGKCVNDMKEVLNYTSPPMLEGKVNGESSTTSLNVIIIVVATSLLRSLLVLLFMASF